MLLKNDDEEIIENISFVLYKISKDCSDEEMNAFMNEALF